MRSRNALRALVPVACTGALLLAGCGEDRQDKDEPSGTFPLEVSSVDFPTSQHLAQRSTLEITVRNTGQQAIPVLAVTVRGFSKRRAEPTGATDAVEPQSDPARPVWIVDTEPEGGQTAYTATWTTDKRKLLPGRSATLRWQVTPVVPGTHTLRYEVAAGLDGKAKAVASGGNQTTGSLKVDIDDAPAQARVDPETGRVIRSNDEDT